MIRLILSIAASFGAALASPANAAGGLTVLVGERGVDYHRFTGGKGYQAAAGTDLTASLFTDPIKEFPAQLGLFYSTQSYALDGAKALFDKGTVTELGPELVVNVAMAKVHGFARYAQTLSGKFSGDIGNTRTLETGAGQTTYQAGSRWSADLRGPHFGAGFLFGNENFGAGAMIDTAFLHSTVTQITVGGRDVTTAFAPYMKTDSDFQSTAFMVALQGRL